MTFHVADVHSIVVFVELIWRTLSRQFRSDRSCFGLSQSESRIGSGWW